ncbi:nucleotidyl transferase AbiEii/AbiGii toxin family protein [bacterium]|nr:MAG: nucleotidyl transferase AbiEii/AbiGii toxin family protein [bacterium]
MTRPPKDIGASVRARLLQISRERREDYQLVLTRYANERLLYRLSVSPYADRFVLKGATLFTLWTGVPHRATRDVDLLGLGDPSERHIRSVFAEILTLDVQDDGVLFDLDSLAAGPIREDQAYGGTRAAVIARIAGAKIRLQIDVGFGDAITPEAGAVEFPTLLDFPAPRLLAYPRETVVAEKLEAMVQLGQANSRMKDFYDLVILSQMFAFGGELVVEAIRATFERRGTPIPAHVPFALTTEFSEDLSKIAQWSAFTRKSGASEIGSIGEVVKAISLFVDKPLRVAITSEAFDGHWPPGGPWS